MGIVVIAASVQMKHSWGSTIIFYPVGTTKEYDSGLYIPVELCSTCYDILLEKNQIADMYAQ